MATSRKVATNENVQTYGAGGFGRDFTSLETWEGATDLNLVSAAQSEVIEVFDDAASFDDQCVPRGATTNSSYFRIIRPAGTPGEASWQGHDGTPNNGFNIINTSTALTFMFRIDEDYCQIQDLILAYNLSDADDYMNAIIDDGCTEAALVGIIADVSSNGGAGVIRGFQVQPDAGEVAYIIDCACLGVDDFAFQIDDKDGDGFVYNCTARNSVNGFEWAGGSGSGTFKNCLADNNTTDFNGGGGNNNASSDATAVGTGPRINQTFTFINAAGGDLHLDGADTGALDFGADLSADGDYAFDDDIDFDTRSGSWDIGFDEFISLISIGYPVLTDGMVSSLIFGRIVR